MTGALVVLQLPEEQRPRMIGEQLFTNMLSESGFDSIVKAF